MKPSTAAIATDRAAAAALAIEWNMRPLRDAAPSELHRLHSDLLRCGVRDTAGCQMAGKTLLRQVLTEQERRARVQQARAALGRVTPTSGPYSRALQAVSESPTAFYTYA